MAFQASKKSTGLAYVLWFFLGSIGGHRFYLRRGWSAATMIVLAILGWSTIAFGVGVVFLAPLGIWLLVDLFTIPGMVAKLNGELMAQLNAAATPKADTADQLSKLAALRDQGALTEEEFAAQKAKLIGA